MMHVLEGSPMFQPIAWTIVIAGAMYTGSLAWNAYYQIQEATEKTLTLQAELMISDSQTQK